MTMAELSNALFPIGVVFVALGFAAHVGHAVMLANGRRAALPVLSAARQPAFAGVVTGSFVTESTRAATGGPTLAASPSTPKIPGHPVVVRLEQPQRQVARAEANAIAQIAGATH